MQKVKDKNPCWGDISKNLVPQVSTDDDLKKLMKLDPRERNAILFVIACWCPACHQCVDKINELSAHLVAETIVAPSLSSNNSKTKTKKQKTTPIAIVMDADISTNSVNEIIIGPQPDSKIRGFPSIVLVKGDKVNLYDSQSSRDPESILKEWNKL